MILIKGMEMPKKCGCCFAAFPDGVGYSCCLIKSYPTIDNQKGRRSDCPLSPVPPHGRVIDADALLKTLGIGDLPIRITYELNNAPTIIPAEPLNEEVNE